MVGHGVGAGVARTQQPRERLAGGIGETEHRVDSPTRPCSAGPCPPWSRCGSRRARRRCRGSPAPSPSSRPSVATPRRALRRTPRASASLVSGVISWKVRNTVESDGADPNRSSWARRCSMSAQLSPPPASISIDWTSTLPRSCSGIRSPRGGIASRERISEPQPVGKGPKSVQSDMAHDPVPPDATTRRRVLLPFILEVPFWSWELGVSTTSVSPDRRAVTRMRVVQFMRLRE